MKCYELQERWFEAYPVEGDQLIPVKVYGKTEVDESIAELEKKLDIYKRGWMENDRVDANQYAEIRKAKRALWLARTEMAKLNLKYWTQYGTGNRVTYFAIDGKSEHRWLEFRGARRLRLSEEWIQIWRNVESKCRAKAKEYK